MSSRSPAWRRSCWRDPRITGTRQGTYLEDLEQRLAHVRITCGDYRRLLERVWPLPARLRCRIDCQPGLYVDPPYGVDRYAAELGAPAEAFDSAELASALEAVEGSLALSDGWACEPWRGARGHYKGARPTELLWTHNAAPQTQTGLF